MEELTQEQEEIAQQISRLPGWSIEGARRSVLAGFVCEYCDLKLLSSFGAYVSWTKDHIVPTSKKGEDIDANLAVSCLSCNRYKSDYNPKYDVGESASRHDLIQAVRTHISQNRTKKNHESNYTAICELMASQQIRVDSE